LPMRAMSSDELARLLDDVRMGPRHWLMFALLCVAAAMDFFDFYVASFLVAVLSPQWKLTFGQSSLMLMSAGLGSIAGALGWGLLSDKIGRKPGLVLGMIICGLCAGSISFISEGDWMIFVVLRFGVGVGLAGAATPTVALLVEHSPLRWRTILSGCVVVFATVGALVASGSAASLLSAFGWRGLAAIGFAPAVLGLLAVVLVPESVRWLLASGRTEQARALASSILGRPLPPIAVPKLERTITRWSALLADPRRFWLIAIVTFAASVANYGVYLWGPIIVAMVAAVPVDQAARSFVLVSSAGIFGKIIFTFLPQRIGRRRAGQIAGVGIAVTLSAAGWICNQPDLAPRLLVPTLVTASFFFDGIFANITPYSAELFPTNVAARGVGLAQASSGVGKIVGPLVLALIAGADNYVTPHATAAAALPAFVFLGGCGLLIALLFTLIGIETHERSISLSAEPPENRPGDGRRPAHSEFIDRASQVDR
jgi:putative MFS transporter